MSGTQKKSKKKAPVKKKTGVLNHLRPLSPKGHDVVLNYISTGFSVRKTAKNKEVSQHYVYSALRHPEAQRMIGEMLGKLKEEAKNKIIENGLLALNRLNEQLRGNTGKGVIVSNKDGSIKKIIPKITPHFTVEFKRKQKTGDRAGIEKQMIVKERAQNNPIRTALECSGLILPVGKENQVYEFSEKEAKHKQQFEKDLKELEAIDIS